jgi:hypothetical protein
LAPLLFDQQKALKNKIVVFAFSARGPAGGPDRGGALLTVSPVSVQRLAILIAREFAHNGRWDAS